jgi:hypothetical protein
MVEMSPNTYALGGFTFERHGEQMVLRTASGSVTTGQAGFLRGIRHLLTMGMDLEGQAELDGGFVFRVEGERVRLRLGAYSEDFHLARVKQLFEQMAAEPA